MAKLLTVKAWIDKMPGAGGALHVRCAVEVATGGWSGSLEKTVPQGFNPTILLLDARLSKPSGPATDVVSEIGLSFSEQPAQQPYSSVEVRLEGQSVSAPVETVQ